MIPESEQLFPVLVYIYNEDGTYGQPFILKDEVALNNPGFMLTIRDAMRRKVQIRMTDSDDYCVFHADKGKVFFDGKTVYPEGRETNVT